MGPGAPGGPSGATYLFRSQMISGLGLPSALQVKKTVLPRVTSASCGSDVIRGLSAPKRKAGLPGLKPSRDKNLEQIPSVRDKTTPTRTAGGISTEKTVLEPNYTALPASEVHPLRTPATSGAEPLTDRAPADDLSGRSPREPDTREPTVLGNERTDSGTFQLKPPRRQRLCRCGQGLPTAGPSQCGVPTAVPTATQSLSTERHPSCTPAAG